MTRVTRAGALVGYDKRGRPIFVPSGGSRDGAIVADDGDDDEPGGADPDGAGADGDESDERSRKTPRPPTYRDLAASVRKLEAAAARNNKELAALRHVQEWVKSNEVDLTDFPSWVAKQAAGAAAAPPPEQAAPPPAEPSGSTQAPDLEAEVARRVELEITRRSIQNSEKVDALVEAIRRSALDKALQTRGYTGTLAAALRMVDVDQIQVDDSGQATGVDDVVGGLATELPQLFTPRRNGPPPPRAPRGADDVDGGNKPPAKPAPKSWEERAIAGLLGKSS